MKKREVIEQQLNEAVEEAAEFYLSIDGDTDNPGFMERRDKIMTLHFELNLTVRLGNKIN